MEGILRRKASPDRAAAMLAAALVKPYNRKLGRWQKISVHLHLLASREVDSQAVVALQARCESLRTDIEAELHLFEAAAAELPPDAASHTKIDDTRRSFKMVLDRLKHSTG